MQSQNHNQNTRCFISFPVFLFLSLFISPAGWAGEITMARSISFGTIDFYPGGDTVIISAQTGAAVPYSSRSIVTGGESGLIRIVSDIEEHVDVLYPASVTLRSGSDTLTITDIDTNSQYSSGGATVPGDGTPLNINLGGKLIFSGDERDGNYSGSFSITLNFQ